jgi:hypothetical protein
MDFRRYRLTRCEPRNEKRIQAFLSRIGWIGVFLTFAIFAGVQPALAQSSNRSSGSDVVVGTSGQTPDSTMGGLDTLERASVTQGYGSPPGGTRRVASYRSVLRRETPFGYDSGGRRDPFRALIWEGKKGEDVVTDLLRLDGAVLTGVVSSEGEYLAMVRDKDGRNFFLREGDSVFRGRVVSVTQTKAVFQLAEFGEVERVTLNVRANENKKGNQ